MKPAYIDLHIHTSDNPNQLNENYDIDALITGIKGIADGNPFLISLTDHNVINKTAYLIAKDKVENLLVGVELHVQNYQECPPYHCHIFFDLEEITERKLDELNTKLDTLYQNKVVTTETKYIPKLEDIINVFDSEEFLLLPHGGQSHATFDRSIPEGTRFDTTMERSIYYNQFDGFTARGNTGLERTQDYFKKLGINEFVNLVTCTDNYVPQNYPNAKAKDANPFVPTWMFAEPTFDGLRLSLSEASRFVYSVDKPSTWSEHIKSVKLSNELIDIDVELTPGLNVVIGGSSTGKTLFVDSVNNAINKNFDDSKYKSFNVESVRVDNPSSVKPHFLSQNYIMRIVSDETEDSIENIDIIKSVFPGDREVKDRVAKGLRGLKTDLKELMNCVKNIETISNQLSRIPNLASLVNKANVQNNILDEFLPTEDESSIIEYSYNDYESDFDFLDDLDKRLNAHPFINHSSELIDLLKEEVVEAYRSSNISEIVEAVIEEEKQLFDEELISHNKEEQTKRKNFDKLIKLIKQYSKENKKFYEVLSRISDYSILCESQEVTSMGHKLYIQNDFKLNKDILLEVINTYLKRDFKIERFQDIQPESLFESKYWKKNPKVRDYDDFEGRVYHDFEVQNKSVYKIVSSEGKNFEDLSAGWKTSVILDIILGYEGDIAPIIIDQPEDNLATNYINRGLVEAIKKIKNKKQVILVSHNATIPMLGDAQNVVVCKSEGSKITIRSAALEGKISGRTIVDFIAEITDGGKKSIKKRVKKYNLKKYQEE